MVPDTSGAYRKPLSGLTVAPESQSAELYDHVVSSFQNADVVVSGNTITGTLKFIEGGLAESGPLSGDGHFLALKISNIDSDATSVKVGLEPSEGTGLVEIIDDPDKNLVAKITSTSQKFVVVQSDNKGNKRKQTFNLSGLTLESAQ